MISESYVEIHAGKCCSFQRIRSVHYFVKMVSESLLECIVGLAYVLLTQCRCRADVKQRAKVCCMKLGYRNAYAVDCFRPRLRRKTRNSVHEQVRTHSFPCLV